MQILLAIAALCQLAGSVPENVARYQQSCQVRLIECYEAANLDRPYSAAFEGRNAEVLAKCVKKG